MHFLPKNNITNYLDGSLQGSDLKAFEQALASDAQLREALDLQRRIEAEIRTSGDDDAIRAMMAKASAAHPYQHAKTRWLIPLLSVAAASLLILAGWFFLQSKRLTAPQLAERYAQLNVPEAVLPMAYGQMRNENNTSSLIPGATSLIDSARRVFYAREYTSALSLYEQLPDSLLTDSLRFERALLYLQTDAADRAIADLDAISNPFDGGVHWYKALAFLQTGDLNAAQTQVQRLVSKYDRPYRKDALKLLDDLQ